MVEDLNKSFPKGKQSSQAKAVIDREAAVTSISQERGTHGIL